MKNICWALACIVAACGAYGIASAQRTVSISDLPFSAARLAGNTLYVSGQIGRTPEGESVTESVAAETQQTMENLGAALKANGYGFEDVVSVTVYLSSMDHYQEMNEAYAKFFTGAYPSRACVGGLEIALGQRVEISCIAYKER